MSLLTDEELAYFNHTLAKGNDALDNDTAANALCDNQSANHYSDDDSLSGHTLSVETEIPQVLTHILGKSKLTLLAEVSHYRLFFPLKLNTDKLGMMSPTIGAPEVVDMRGKERSWRLDEVKGAKIINDNCHKDIEVLSLSSSGMTIKLPQDFEHKREHSSELILPDGTHLDMAFEEVRTENGIMAAKINTQGQPREALREFLFNQHKAKYSHLYEGLSN